MINKKFAIKITNILSAMLLIVGSFSLAGCDISDVLNPSNGLTYPIDNTTEISATENNTAVDPNSKEYLESQIRTPEYNSILTEINHHTLDEIHKSYLTDEEVKMYEVAMDALLNRESEVFIKDDYDFTLNVFSAIKSSTYYYLLSECHINSAHNSLLFEYKFSEDEQKEIVDFIDNEYLDIINYHITPDMNDLDKVLAIYHYFAERISYDYDWIYMMDTAENPWEVDELTIYDGLKNNSGVCHTYAYLCEYAFEQLGIYSFEITGDTNAGDGHMWLIVNIDGHLFHIDPTWDSNNGNVGLFYFGMTDTENADRGINPNTILLNTSLGEISCDDDRFSSLRGIYNYEMMDNHQILVYRIGNNQDIVEVINTEDFFN